MPLENCFLARKQFRISARCERSVLAIFFIGSMRERMDWRHHSSRNLPAQLGDSYSQSCWKSSFSR
jgi:hypothetical protein